jgi:flavin reductase (DIM6/NTAB) family NADH-FMN oxidoreductase RutF
VKRSIELHPLPFPAPVWVVGTYDSEGRADMMTAAWAGVSCSEPLCVSVSVRPSRYTHDNIIRQKCFTVNIPSAEFVRETDYFGLVSGRDEDKTGKAELKVEKSSSINAPVLADFPLVIECRLFKQVELGSHTEFIGEVLEVRAEEGLLKPDGSIDPEKAGFFVLFNGYRGIAGVVGDPYSSGKELSG